MKSNHSNWIGRPFGARDRLPFWPARGALMLLLAVAIAAPALAQLPDSPADADITFHITDFGIRQWHEDLRSGQDFGQPIAGGHTPNLVYPNLCGSGTCSAQILLVMPNNARLDTMSHAQLMLELLAQLRDRVDLAIASGVREFEIQLVQNINAPGYFSSKQQGRVKKFGQAAFLAIGEVRNSVSEQRKLSVYTDATVGSNGTVMLTENRTSWANYLQAVDLFDGRASMQATIKTIDAVRKLTGKNNVRLFTAKGDWPSANRPQAWLLRILPPLALGRPIGDGPNIAIGNGHVAAEIKRQRPDTQTFLVERLDRKHLRTGSGHIAAMNGRDLAASTFRAREIVPNRQFGYRTTPGVIASYDDLRTRASVASRPADTPTVSRGGVLMTTEGKTESVDLHDLRERILRRPADAALSWDVDLE